MGTKNSFDNLRDGELIFLNDEYTLDPNSRAYDSEFNMRFDEMIVKRRKEIFRKSSDFIRLLKEENPEKENEKSLKYIDEDISPNENDLFEKNGKSSITPIRMLRSST